MVIVSEELCAGCGLCAKDCVGGDIEIVDGKAKAKGVRCIQCGHCEAICPCGAISLDGYDDEVEEFEEQTRLDPDELLKAMKTRRSIRQFKADKVPSDVIDMIIEAGRQAPTGSNAQKTGYVVIEKKLAVCEGLAVNLFGKLIKTGKKVIPALKGMEIDKNFFFKKAPLVIVVTGGDKVSASLAAQNMATMAEAHGLGVLFSGFFTMSVNFSSTIKKTLGLSKEKRAVTTLVIGYPDVKYKRNVHRKNADVIRI